MAPTMTILHNTSAGHDQPATRKAPAENFTGEVWMDICYRDDTISVVNVMFTPCARTNWHTHENGQLLRVMAGSGWICDKGDTPKRIKAGDTVWCPAGTTHFHGADVGSFMTHTAVSHGKVTWLERVSDEEYEDKS